MYNGTCNMQLTYRLICACVMQGMVLAGKRKEVAEKVAAAAGHALMRLL